MDNERLKVLKKIALNARRDCIKVQKLVASGHLGGSFSAIELMTYLYFEQMAIDPKNPLKEERDIFILSKGHASLGYYSILSRRGFFPLEELKSYRQINSRLQGHTHIDSAPGIECSTGSLGQGLSYGIGLALGYKRKGMKNKVYVILGDGEIQEGQVWEALMLQGNLQLDNLITIIDYNGIQLDDRWDNIMGQSRLKEKLEGFNHHVIEVNGHNFKDIERSHSNLQAERSNVILASTVKGKGISFMEDQVIWHAKKVNAMEYQQAMEELDRQEVMLNV